MLEEMRSLALDFLFKRLGVGEPPPNLHIWFKEVRQKNLLVPTVWIRLG
jgi:hypothetical protein